MATGRASSSRSRDTGKGMDRATARHVFRPGFSTKRRGWGLGLSLARRIVEAYHGGELTVAETRPGDGTTFRITLDAPARASRVLTDRFRTWTPVQPAATAWRTVACLADAPRSSVTAVNMTARSRHVTT